MQKSKFSKRKILPVAILIGLHLIFCQSQSLSLPENENPKAQYSFREGIRGKRITSEFMEFLLSRPENSADKLRYFSFRFINCKIDPNALKLLGKSRNVRALSLENCKSNRPLLSEIAALDELQDLRITNCAVNDVELSFLAKLTELQSLDLQKTGIDGSCLEKIPNPEKLNTLNLSDTKVSSRHVAVLKRFKNLESLFLANSFVTGKTFLRNNCYPEVAYFTAYFKKDPIDWMVALSHFNRLKGITRGGPRRLDLSCCEFRKDASTRFAKDLDFIGELDLSNCRITPVALKNLCRLSKLYELDASNCNLTGQGFGVLNCIPDLTYLCLDKNPLTSKGLEDIGSLHALEKLSLRGSLNNVHGRKLSGLERSSIQTLDLFSTKLTAADFESIQKMPKLKKLGLQGSKFQSWMTDYLAECKSLTCLNLASAKGLNNRVVQSFLKLKGIRSLIINFSDISKEDELWLAKNMPEVSLHVDKDSTIDFPYYKDPY